jgi:hypothetical protein
MPGWSASRLWRQWARGAQHLGEQKAGLSGLQAALPTLRIPKVAQMEVAKVCAALAGVGHGGHPATAHASPPCSL